MLEQLGFVNRASSCGRFHLRHILFFAVVGFIALTASGCDRIVHDASQEKDVRELTHAMDSFRERFGTLPPSADDPKRFSGFVRKAFPTARVGGATPVAMDPAHALVFWLSGVSTSSRTPFEVGAKDRHEFFKFPQDRVRGARFYPTVEMQSDPYVYFHFEDYGRTDFNGFRPYYRRDGANKTYFASDSMQIIGPGKDGKLGRGGLITELSEEDRDNVVSFDTRRVGDIGVEE